MYVAPPPPPAPKKRGAFGQMEALDQQQDAFGDEYTATETRSPTGISRTVKLITVNGKVVPASPPGTRLHVPGFYDDATQAAMDAKAQNGATYSAQQAFGAAPPTTNTSAPAKTIGTVIGGLLGSAIGAKIGNMLGGLIKTSKSPQRVQQAQQMAQAVVGGNLSALRRLRERFGQFSDDANGFGPALRLLQSEGVINSSDQYLVGTPGFPWTEEGHAEMFDGPPVFSTSKPAGAVEHPEAYVGPPAAVVPSAPPPSGVAPLPIATPQITPPPSAPILPGAPPTVITPIGVMTPEQIKALVLQLQGQNAAVPDWAKQMLAVLQGGVPPTAPSAPMPVMPETPGAKPQAAGFTGSTAMILGAALLGAIVLGGKKRGRR